MFLAKYGVCTKTICKMFLGLRGPLKVTSVSPPTRNKNLYLYHPRVNFGNAKILTTPVTAITAKSNLMWSLYCQLDGLWALYLIDLLDVLKIPLVSLGRGRHEAS